jgi:hypothetical protein
MAILVNQPRWTGLAGPSAGIVVGVALMFAPALFGYTGTGQEVAHRIAGPVMVMLWIPSYWEATRSLIWWAGIVALGLLVASVLAAGPVRAVATGVSGALASLIITLLTYPGDVAMRYAGGWEGLWTSRAPNGSRGSEAA